MKFSSKCDLFSRSLHSSLRMRVCKQIIIPFAFYFRLLENMVQQNERLYCSLSYRTVAIFKSAI